MSTDRIRTAYPAGTSVVTEVDREANDVRKPAGRVGVIVDAPARHDGPYRVEFPDGTELSYRHEELRSRRRELGEVIGDHRRPSRHYEQFVVYECVVGSVAYGLATEDSDVDRRGFYVPPTDHYFGLPELTPPEQIQGERDPETKKPPPGEDWVYWEVQKYVRQLLSANPSYLETLWTPRVVRTSEVAERLRDLRRRFLSRQLARTYSGYALSQMKRIQKAVEKSASGDPTDYRSKHAMHLLRLLYTGAHALETGELTVEVGPELRERLLEVRRDPPPIDDLRSHAREIVRTRFDPALADTNLPEQPDFDSAHAYLTWVRREAIGLTPEQIDRPGSPFRTATPDRDAPARDDLVPTR